MNFEYDFTRGKRGPVLPAPGKTRITIRIDDDVLDWFRSRAQEEAGGAYQTLVNAALREYMAREVEPLEATVRRVVREELRRYGGAASAAIEEAARSLEFDPARLADLCRRHGVQRLRIFGSVSRGEAVRGSDVDLIVDFASVQGFFELIRLEDEFADFFGRPVDLVTEAGLSPHLREAILSSARVIYDAAA